MPSVRSFTATIGTRLDGSPLALMLDVDGTLAPIAPTPDAASIPPETRELLRRLAALPDVAVALVSGRAAEDALRMAGIDGVWIVGNHGFELRTPAGQLTANQEAKEYETAISRAAHELTPLEQSVPGAIVENKRWGLSLHYRLVEPNAVAALSRRAEEIAHEFGLRLHSGKKMLELRPPVHVDKGTITVDLAERVGAFRQGGSIFYAGDDRTDEDAFRALRAREPRAVTARVLSAEDVAGENTDAEFMLQSVNELRQVLLWLEARRASTAHA